MNPSLPNEDLVFCLKLPILNLTQRLLEGRYVVEGFPQHGLHAVHVVCCNVRSVGGSYIFLGNRDPLTGRNSRPIPTKRVNTFKYLRSTSEEEKLDAEVTHRVQNG